MFLQAFLFLQIPFKKKKKLMKDMNFVQIGSLFIYFFYEHSTLQDPMISNRTLFSVFTQACSRRLLEKSFF